MAPSGSPPFAYRRIARGGRSGLPERRENEGDLLEHGCRAQQITRGLLLPGLLQGGEKIQILRPSAGVNPDRGVRKTFEDPPRAAQHHFEEADSARIRRACAVCAGVADRFPSTSVANPTAAFLLPGRQEGARCPKPEGAAFSEDAPRGGAG